MFIVVSLFSLFLYIMCVFILVLCNAFYSVIQKTVFSYFCLYKTKIFTNLSVVCTINYVLVCVCEVRRRITKNLQ